MYVKMIFRMFIMVVFLLPLLEACETVKNESIDAGQTVGTIKVSNCPESLIPTGEKREALKKEINFTVKQKELGVLFTKKHDSARFNGCVLVAEKGVILYQNCFGEDCNGKDEPEVLSFTSRFQLASMTKTFTAVAVLKLMEEKKLSLEDSLQKFFPEFPYKGITIKMLLSHRSGLPYYAYAFQDSTRYGQYGPDNAEVLQWFIKVKPDPYDKPDKGFSYNNTNYMLLALIIEQVSGMTYSDYIRKKICIPLGMKNTFVFDPS